MDIPDSYHKARRNLIFFSGLLLSWEFVGVEINDLSHKDLSIKFQNPDALPLVISFLICYYIYRLWTEFNLITLSFEKPKYFSREFKFTLGISIFSLIVFAIQKLLEFQIFDNIDIGIFIIAIAGGVTGLVTIISITTWKSIGKSKNNKIGFLRWATLTIVMHLPSLLILINTFTDKAYFRTISFTIFFIVVFVHLYQLNTHTKKKSI